MMSLLAVVIVTEQSQRKDLAAALRYVPSRQHLFVCREAVELYYYIIIFDAELKLGGHLTEGCGVNPCLM